VVEPLCYDAAQRARDASCFVERHADSGTMILAGHFRIQAHRPREQRSRFTPVA